MLGRGRALCAYCQTFVCDLNAYAQIVVARRHVEQSSSYLPFMFASSSRSASGNMGDEEEEDESPVARMKGRRAFNKAGKEVDVTESEVRYPL